MDLYLKYFDKKFSQRLETYEKVIIPNQKIKQLNKFINDVVKEKNKENHHKIDNFNEHKRFYTGMLGELAIEEYLGINFVDFSIGSSLMYNKADLNKIGINMGIKTVEYGKFPIINKNPMYPEIICVKYNSNTVYICGIATVNTLMTYQNDSLILSKKLRDRNVKTGFEGMTSLIPIRNYYDIKKIRKAN